MRETLSSLPEVAPAAIQTRASQTRQRYGISRETMKVGICIYQSIHDPTVGRASKDTVAITKTSLKDNLIWIHLFHYGVYAIYLFPSTKQWLVHKAMAMNDYIGMPPKLLGKFCCAPSANNE